MKNLPYQSNEDVINHEDARRFLLNSLNTHPIVGDLSGMEIAYYVTYGFINSTIGLDDLNSTNCLKYIN
jgi:hypothetical protein